MVESQAGAEARLWGSEPISRPWVRYRLSPFLTPPLALSPLPLPAAASPTTFPRATDPHGGELIEYQSQVLSCAA